jgi:uncharacterized protein (DUF2336 family)
MTDLPRDEVGALKREMAGCLAQRPERAKEIVAQLASRGVKVTLPAGVETRELSPGGTTRKKAG